MDTQITEFMLDTTRQLSAIQESVDSAHKRIDENTATLSGIHDLAASVKLLAIQVKSLTERIEGGLKSQGERIGALEKEPGQKWKTVTAQIVSIIVAAVVTGLVVRFTGQ